MLPLPLHLSLPTAPSHSLPLPAGPATLPLPFKLNPISFLSKKSPLFHNIIGKGGDLIGARVATAPSSPPLKKLVFTLPTSPHLPAHVFFRLPAFACLIIPPHDPPRRALVTALLEIHPTKTRSLVRPRKRRGGRAQISNARSIILERMDGRGRAGGREEEITTGDDVHSAFCKEQRSRRDTSSPLPPPSLIPLSPREETGLARRARRRLLRVRAEGTSERASVSVGTWNIAPFLPSTRPALPLPRASVSRAEQLHLAKLHETMNR